MRKSLLSLAAALVLGAGLAAPSAQAAGFEVAALEPTLKVGDAAPAFSVESFIQGEKFEAFESGKVYVVEFWATWCTPCVASIPHLTELQKKYPNITIIGVTASEQPSRANLDDRLTKAEAFVAKQGARMEYTVAYDGNGFMWSNWMIPAQRGGIPATFIVGPEGRIEWVGHPQMDEFDRALDAVVSQPGVRSDASNWRTIMVKPLNSTTPATKKPAAPDRISTTQPTKIAPASTRLPAKPAPAAKKIATGPDRGDSALPR